MSRRRFSTTERAGIGLCLGRLLTGISWISYPQPTLTAKTNHLERGDFSSLLSFKRNENLANLQKEI